MKRFRVHRLRPVLLAWACVLVASASGHPAGGAEATSEVTAPPPYKLADGSYQVEQARNITLHDPKRDKDLLVTATYPKGDGPFPMIVFSHGAGGAGDTRMPLVRFWASHGYVILAPTHADSIALRRGKEPDVNMGGVMRKAMADGEGWKNRARDVSFVIDSLGEIQEKVTALKGKLDAKRLGVGGHSYGAYTSQLIAGAKVALPAGVEATTLADERPRAFLLLSPQGRGQMGLAANSWEKIARPMMAMTGSRDRGATGQGPEEKLEPFKLAPAGDKYGVLIRDAYHMSFLGRTSDIDGGAAALTLLMSPGIAETDQAAVFNQIKVATIAFWDAYLRDDAKAKAYLQSDALPTWSNGAVRLDRK
jgi:predicted dienelactone hydrolase